MDEYNQENRNNEPKVEILKNNKRCMTETAWNTKDESGEDGK